MSWIPVSKDTDYDGTYLAYIEKTEVCGAVNHYQRTVENRKNKWVLDEGEKLLFWMNLPPMPICDKNDERIASHSCTVGNSIEQLRQRLNWGNKFYEEGYGYINPEKFGLEKAIEILTKNKNNGK